MSENQSSLAHYLSVVRRQLWLILLLPAVALASAGVVVLLQDTVYRASSKIVRSMWLMIRRVGSPPCAPTKSATSWG